MIDFVENCFVDSEEQDLSTPLLQMQKTQLNDIHEDFERNCNVLPVFGFSSAKYDMNLIKSDLLPTLEKGQDIERTVIKNLIILFPLSSVIFSYLTL